MKRWIPVTLILALICACSNTPVRIESRALDGLVSASPERFIVAAVDDAPGPFLARAGGTPRGYDSIAAYGATFRARGVMHSVANEYGLREISAWPIAPLHMHCAVLEIPEGSDRMALLHELSQDRRIKLAQPLQMFATRTEDYNDPYVELQRGFQQMDVAGAHPWSRGEDVRLAIIDTGVDTEHPDLKGSITLAANFVDSDAGQFRRDRHGTEMAGVIAAVANNHEGIVGVAPGVHLLVFKACWQARPDADAASCNSFTLARALVAALDSHAQIVNLSLAGPEDPLLRDLIREGLSRGVLFVGAAPPALLDGRASVLHQPGVIEVASSENHSTSGSAVYAPGQEILTLLPGGHYDFASGDSIATAQVSGVVALLLAKDHGLSAAAAYQLLRSTSTQRSDAAGNVERVDACAAVIALLKQGACKSSGDIEQHRLAGKQ